ncbi:ester cyclase [Kitasatospora sp. NPDC001664]
MGEARELMDRLTAAVTGTPDLEALGECLAEDVVASTPDQPELRGRKALVDYFGDMTESVPDARFEATATYEAGDTAIDEGYYTGRNTGPLTMPDGSKLPPTQREIRIRGCDLATVRDGRIVEYRLYFDQFEFMSQLGLVPEE